MRELGDFVQVGADRLDCVSTLGAVRDEAQGEEGRGDGENGNVAELAEAGVGCETVGEVRMRAGRDERRDELVRLGLQVVWGEVCVSPCFPVQ